MNTMVEAFKTAGVKSPHDRLKEIALTEMVAHADNTMAAIEGTWAKVQKDCDLLIALFNPYGEYRGAIGRIFNQVKTDVAYSQRQGIKMSAKEKKAFAIVKRDREEERKEREEQAKLDREREIEEKRRYSEYLASWHKTPLFGLNIGDKPIWENSVATIRAWLPSQKRKLRVVELLIEGVPEDGRPLEYYRTADEAREIAKLLDEK